jgi:hypothetical protein
VTVHTSAYDYYGVLAYEAASDGVPKPIDPANGTLACNGGYSVPLQIRAGPDLLGVVRDQYVILPLLASPPAGTTLTCTSRYGLYTTAGTLIASNTLNASIVYDANGTTITFDPATATVAASGGNAPIFIDYTSTLGFSIVPTSPANATLACPGGYAPQTQLRAGPGKAGIVVDQLAVLTYTIAPPPGTTLPCTVTYGLRDTNKTIVATATASITLQY